jgi:hypothetical protein
MYKNTVLYKTKILIFPCYITKLRFTKLYTLHMDKNNFLHVHVIMFYVSLKLKKFKRGNCKREKSFIGDNKECIFHDL